jgi:hypothetical protein
VNQEDQVRRFVDELWNDYRAKVPDARAIEDALKTRGEAWREDHIALRCLPDTPATAAVVGAYFEALGYQRQESYRFEDKKLNAFWLKPPCGPTARADAPAPKIFISELDVASFTAAQQKLLRTCIEQVRPILRPAPLTPDQPGAGLEQALRALCFQGDGGVPVCPLSFDTYTQVRSLSEYAAWTLVFGVCVNHFTVSVHLMQHFSELADLNQFIRVELGIPLNTTGGEIKGSRAVKLEQSATLAAEVPVRFADRTALIPYAFIEFARRHLLDERANPDLFMSYYQGFVEGNADKIFSSTDPQKAGS